MKSLTLKEALTRLKNVRRNKSGNTARCPAHDDKRNSLSVNERSDGGVLFHCHAGCSFEDIQKALGLNYEYKSRNVKVSRRIVATYDYRDENGNLLYQVIRQEPKSFAHRVPDGKGDFIYKLGNVRRVLYRLPQLLKSDSSQTVFICEGEKDADRMAVLGLIATTNSSGAGKWRDEYNKSLQGRPVVILPDNDSAGMQHAEQVAKSLYGTASSIRILSLPNLPHKGDVSD